MIVKICGITNLEDALAAIRAGALALGFNFCRASPRYLAPEAAGEIIAALPAGICKVGVFVNESPGFVAEVVNLLRLDVAQLHGNETASQYPEGLRIWKAVRVDSSAPPSWEEDPAEAMLLDGPSSGRTFNWRLARSTRKRVIVAGGLDADNVRQAIEQARPWGVDACSRLESAPGKKDHLKMAAFLEAALRPL